MPDVNLLPVEMDRCNKAVLVSADIEYDPLIHLVRGWKYGVQLIPILKRSSLQYSIPAQQGFFAVCVPVPELQ
jgi:hypothetical protein